MRKLSDDEQVAVSGPTAEESERPEQNVGYDEAVKGAPLSPEERHRAEAESPLSDEDPPPGPDVLLDE